MAKANTKNSRNNNGKNESANSNQFEPRKSCVFYTAWYDAIERLPKKEQLNAFKMLLDYSLRYIEPEDTESKAYTVFIMAKPAIESAERRYNNAIENGRKGGRPATINHEEVIELHNKGMTPTQIAKELSINRESVKSILYRNKGANANQNVNVKDNENVNEKEKDNINIYSLTPISIDKNDVPTEQPIKKKYLSDLDDYKIYQDVEKYGEDFSLLVDKYNKEGFSVTAEQVKNKYNEYLDILPFS